MELQTHAKPKTFLSKTLTSLHINEAANNLMLGISLRLNEDELFYGIPPFMATIEENCQLIAAGVMTPPYNLIVYCHQENRTDVWPLLVESLQSGGWQVPGVIGESNHARAFAETWQQITGEEFIVAMNQRVFELRAVTPPCPTPGYMRAAQTEELPLILQWSTAFLDEALGGTEPRPSKDRILQRIQAGEIYVWDHNGVVSMAGSSRPAGKGIGIGLVYTPPEERRKGYATALVAAFSQRLLDSGYEYCTLFTDLANPTSNAIYRRIGYRAVCDFQMFRFIHRD